MSEAVLYGSVNVTSDMHPAAQKRIDEVSEEYITYVSCRKRLNRWNNIRVCIQAMFIWGGMLVTCVVASMLTGAFNG
jgi:hypothetical protein